MSARRRRKPPLVRMLGAMTAADAAAVRLGVKGELRFLVRIHDRKANVLEVQVRAVGGDWRTVGKWKRGRIASELLEEAERLGWSRKSAATKGDEETFAAAFDRVAQRKGDG